MSDTITRESNEQTTHSAQARSGFGVAEWLSIAQLVALVIGGVWAAFLFLKFDAHDKDLNRQKTVIELRRLNASPLTFDQDISIWTYRADGKKMLNELGVDYHYVITNSTNHSIRVALLVVHALLLPPQNIGIGDAFAIPSVSLAKGSPWRQVVSKAYLADGEEVEGGVVTSAEGEKIVPTKGGDATGDLEPGGRTWGSLSLIVRAPKADYIGFTVDAFVRLDKAERWISSNEYARLVPGDYSGSPKSHAQPVNTSSEK